MIENIKNTAVAQILDKYFDKSFRETFNLESPIKRVSHDELRKVAHQLLSNPDPQVELALKAIAGGLLEMSKELSKPQYVLPEVWDKLTELPYKERLTIVGALVMAELERENAKEQSELKMLVTMPIKQEPQFKAFLAKYNISLPFMREERDGTITYSMPVTEEEADVIERHLKLKNAEVKINKSNAATA